MTIDDAQVFERFPDVLLTPDNLEHYRGLLQRKLLINRCGNCGYWVYPHRPICPECWSWSLTPTPVSGRGHVFMFTRVPQARANDAAGQAFGTNLVLVAVELVEQVGLRYLSTVEGLAFEELHHGMEVELAWHDSAERPIPVFRMIQSVGNHG